MKGVRIGSYSYCFSFFHHLFTFVGILGVAMRTNGNLCPRLKSGHAVDRSPKETVDGNWARATAPVFLLTPCLKANKRGWLAKGSARQGRRSSDAQVFSG